MQSSCLFPRNSSSLNTKFKVAGRRIRKEKSKNDLRTNVVALFYTNHFAMRIGLAPPALPWHLFLLAKRKSLWSIVAFGVWNPSFVPTRLFGTELFPSPLHCRESLCVHVYLLLRIHGTKFWEQSRRRCEMETRNIRRWGYLYSTRSPL